MDFTKASFDDLVARNLLLEQQVSSNTEFSSIEKLNESQMISRIGSWTWDIKSNEVEWSDMMYILLGLSPSEKIPSYELALSHVHEEDKTKYEKKLRIALDRKEDYYFENKIVKKDKSIINVISRGKCICDKNNDLIRMVGTVQDISNLKQILDSNTQLEQFAHILSHDFKTPIRSIISFINLIRKKSFENLNEDGKEYFTFIETGARNLSVLVNDILEFSKLTAPHLKFNVVSMSKLITAVVFDLNEKLEEKKGTIIIGWLPESISVDEIKIRQVIQNLVSNAIKYTAPNVKPEISIYCEESEKEFTFYVVDNGIGIEEEFIDKIFEPYIRSHAAKSFSGTGIGLSISRRIIQLHQGKLQHSNIEEDGGSSFYFSIPKKV